MLAGSAAAHIRELRLRSAVGAPVVVGGRMWGAAIVGSSRPGSLPPTPRGASGISRIWLRPRSRTPRPARSSPLLGRGSSSRPIMRDAVSNATCTTAPNSGWSRWVSTLRTAEASVPPGLPALKEQISRCRGRSDRCLGGSPRDLPGDSSGDPVQGRTGPGAQDARTPLQRSCRTPARPRRAVGGVCRSGRVLRCIRSPYERGQACARLRGGGVR